VISHPTEIHKDAKADSLGKVLAQFGGKYKGGLGVEFGCKLLKILVEMGDVGVHAEAVLGPIGQEEAIQ
jgi:hypothetical protein